MNINLLSFADERIKKFLSKLNLLKYKPAVVQRVDVDNVKVKFDDGTIVDLPNLSGNFVLPNTVVLVYYWGNIINKNTAYIGKNATSVIVCDSTEYDARDNVLYFLKDTGEIYIGNRSYGANKEELENMFEEIKRQLDEIKAILEGNKNSQMYGVICGSLIGLNKGISGDLTIVESEG